MKIAIDENYAKYFLSFGYNRHIDTDQMISEFSKTIDGMTATFSNAEVQIIIPTTQEDSLMSIILKLIKKTSK